MLLTIVNTTDDQRKAGKEAALARFEFNKNTPDRPGWNGGKCPVIEFRAIMAEMGAANALGFDWHDLCLFSTNRTDFTRPDIGDWEVKAGSTFTKKDIAKGARYIIWVTPMEKTTGFYCRVSTCNDRYHQYYDNKVEIRGWTDLSNPADYSDFGDFYKPSNMRNANTLPKVVR